MGVVRHAAEAFQHLEQQLIQKREHVEQGLTYLANEINYQKKRRVDEINLRDTRMHFIEITAMIVETYKQIDKRYSTLHETPEISDADLRTIIEKINKNVSEGVIPPIEMISED